MTDSPSAARLDSHSSDFGDAAYREAVIELLGAIAYGELSAFERMVDDAEMAPSLGDKMAMCGMAVKEFGHVQRLLDRIEGLGANPVAAMDIKVMGVVFHCYVRCALARRRCDAIHSLASLKREHGASSRERAQERIYLP